MAAGVTRSSADVGTIGFELERFEATGEERLEIVGRWFGVRGRRFVRPTLTLAAGGVSRRVLAGLDHKPWAAEDGELWIATFPLDLRDDQIDSAELAVSPDIAIELPAQRPSGRGKGGRASAPTWIERTPVDGASAPQPNGATPRRAQARPIQSADDPRSELDLARAEISELRATRDAAYQRLKSERDALASARAQLRDVGGADAEAERFRRERDDAMAALTETVAELDQLRSERQAALAARDLAAAERDEARRTRVELIARLDAARQDVDATVRERDRARREHQGLGRERDDLLRENRELQSRSREAADASDALRRDLAVVQKELDAARRDAAATATRPAARDLAPGPSAGLRPPAAGAPRGGAILGEAPGRPARFSRARLLVVGALALLVLVIVVLVRLSM